MPTLYKKAGSPLRRDIATGGLGTVPPALNFLRKVNGKYDRVVVVGDMVGVLACYVSGHRGLYYLDVYKTGAARLYSGPERWAIKRACKTVFCRADNTARSREQTGGEARPASNRTIEATTNGKYKTPARRSRALAVTLLPGSRALTSESFALQVDALRSLPATEMRPDVFLAVAGSVSVDELARQTGLKRTPMLSVEPSDLGELSDGDLTIHMARGGAMGNLLAASDLVLSQAGTATVQALGLGKPAITFVNPRDRRSRFSDEQMLFGEARTVVTAEAAAIGAALRHLLSDDEERRRLANIGRQRIGGPGAMHAIIDALVG